MNILQDKIERYFKKMRHDHSHHLGLGDIRLTIAQQDEIVEMAKGGEGVSSECNTLLASGEDGGNGGPQNVEVIITLLKDWYFWKTLTCDHCDGGVEEVECSCMENLDAQEEAEEKLMEYLNKLRW